MKSIKAMDQSDHVTSVIAVKVCEVIWKSIQAINFWITLHTVIAIPMSRGPVDLLLQNYTFSYFIFWLQFLCIIILLSFHNFE